MQRSTLTSKGQTTVPKQVREALHLMPNQKMLWDILPDGTVKVRSQPSVLDFMGCLKTDVEFPGLEEERNAMIKDLAEHAANEGLD
jgi:bifunctional DNA-binding transcriptional regulator/antitoxin component of YhaV-PrlF toxin-antitoxin module